MMACVNAARHHATSVGTSTRTRAATPAPDDTGPGAVPTSPPAMRHRRPSWRDPRLVVGIVMVTGSVLLGAHILADADDTVAVWSVRTDLSAGTPVSAADLRPAHVRFTSEELAERYVPVGAAPEDMVLLRDVAADELLPRAALGPATAEETAELPIAVASESVPAGLRAGEVVDVWVTRRDGMGDGTSDGGRAVRVLERVRVVAVPQSSNALGPSSTRQVVVGIPGDAEELLARALARFSEGTAVLVRRG
jgi:hypothetical protein